MKKKTVKAGAGVLAGVLVMVGATCFAAKEQGGRLPFLDCPNDMDGLTSEVIVEDGNFSVRVPSAYGNSPTRRDLGSIDGIESLVRYRIAGPSETQWVAVDHMALKKVRSPSEDIGVWAESAMRRAGGPDLSAQEGVDVKVISFTRLRPDVDAVFLARHKAQKMSAHHGTVRVGRRLCRVFVVCIGRERENWKMTVVFPLDKGIAEKDALKVTSAENAAAGVFFGSFKVLTPSAKASKSSAVYRQNAEIVKRYLDENDWHYEMKDTGDSVIFNGGIGGFKGVYESFRFAMVVGDDTVQNFSTYPASAKGKQSEMAEFLIRANYGMKYGAFEMDWSDGEVRFHVAIPMAAIKADNDEVVRVLALPASMLGKYSKGFSAVLLGVMTPAEAVQACEEGD